ncbi:MAG: Bug family tripartite tricarboxylate transporter substrate binding protein [Burkholderiales bacterium]
MQSYRAAACLLLAAAAAGGIAHAQTYPTRPVRIVTSTPGGGNDYLARIISPALSTALGQQVIVDNRPSRFVGGIVARATPDGYTLVVGGGTMQFVPLLERADYDLLTHFAPISQLERSPNVLVVNPSLKVSSVKELIALARSKPGTLLYGSGGSGASLHVAGEMFMMQTNTRIMRVPYKSTGPALLGLLTNEVHMVFATPGGVMSHIKDGKLKALGVTSAQPFPLIPGVPTIASQGVPDFDLDTIGFIMAPAKTPPHLVKLLNQHVLRIMHTPDVKERMAGGGSEVVTGTPQELAAKLKADDVKMRKLYQHIGLTPEK